MFGDWVSPYVECTKTIVEFHRQTDGNAELLMHTGTANDALLTIKLSDPVLDTTALEELGQRVPVFRCQCSDAKLHVEDKTITYHLVHSATTPTMFNLPGVTTKWMCIPAHVKRIVETVKMPTDSHIHATVGELVGQYIRAHTKTGEFDVELETTDHGETCVLFSGVQWLSARFCIATIRTPQWHVCRVVTRGNEARFVFDSVATKQDTTEGEGSDKRGMIRRITDRMRRFGKALRPY